MNPRDFQGVLGGVRHDTEREDRDAPHPIEAIHAATVQDRNAWKMLAVGLADAIKMGDLSRVERLSKAIYVHADQTVRSFQY